MRKIISTAIAALILLGGAQTALAEKGDAGLTLAESSHLVLDEDRGYVDMIDGTITVGELKANFASDITVTGKDGVKTDGTAVATDDTVSTDGDSLRVLIYGDVDRNGKIALTDASGIMKSAAKWSLDINQDAADVDRNGKVNLADASKLLKYTAGWSDVSLGNVRWVFDNTKLTAEHEDGSVELFFTDMMNKTARDDIKNTGENSFKIKCAKNEAESCQVILTAKEEREGLCLSLGDFVHEYGDATLTPVINEVFYYPDHAMLIDVAPDRNLSGDNWTYGDFPEVLLPQAESFELESGFAKHFVITVTTDENTPAGMYKSVLEVKNAEGQVIKCAEVCVLVWDFTLPITPSSASLFKGCSYDGDYPDYFNLLLENNLSAYLLPVEVYTDEAEAYMSDPRVTAFIIDGFSGPYTGDLTDEETKLAYKKVMSDEEWAKKGLFYYTDEPYAEGLLDVKTTYEHLVQLLGTDEGIRNITPLANNSTFADMQSQIDGIDPVAYIDPYINVWCPQSPAFHLLEEGGTWTPKRFISKFGEFADRAAAFKEAGEEMWWYVCCSPEPPYANYFTWYQGVIVRLLSWQQFYNDVDGVLYYSTGEGWGGITKYKFDIGNGDGTLMYAGERFGFEGPQASWRLFQIRDGFDDIDYLTIAEQLCGLDRVIEIVKTVSDGMLSFTEDYRVLDAARDAVAQMILREMDKAE